MRGAKVEEIVFFGRLETRKGLKLFVDAIAALSQSLQGVAITFMGRIGQIDGRPADLYIEERFRSLSLRLSIKSNFDRQQAYEYVTAAGRLVVLASPVDNSPCTVYELLEVGARFIACRGGGIPELIHPDCHSSILFDYTLDTLLAALRRELSGPCRLAMPALSRQHIEARWLSAHNDIAAEIAASPSRMAEPYVGSLAAAIVFDGDNSALANTVQALRADVPADDIFIVVSERRGRLRGDVVPAIRRLSLDALGHRGVAVRLAALGKPVVLLRSGALMNCSGIDRLRVGSIAVHAIVPFATTIREADGVPAVQPHLAGSTAWTLLYGGANSAAIVSPDLLALIAAQPAELPGTNIMVWIDVAVLARREILALAEVLVDATGVDRVTHHVSDERARLTLYVNAQSVDQRLLSEAAYGFMVQRAASGARGDAAGSLGLQRSTLGRMLSLPIRLRNKLRQVARRLSLGWSPS